jgi:hypothetical protein
MRRQQGASKTSRLLRNPELDTVVGRGLDGRCRVFLITTGAEFAEPEFQLADWDG